MSENAKGTKSCGRTSLALDGPQLRPGARRSEIDVSGTEFVTESREGGDRRTFGEALHFLTVEIEVGWVAFLPDVNAT